MLKKFAMASALSLGLLGIFGPAHADVVVDQILVNQAAPLPEATNVRVNLLNTGVDSMRPAQVQLWARTDEADSWRLVKTWDLAQRDVRLGGGERLALDYLPAQGEALDPALQQTSYQLKAVVTQENGQVRDHEQFISQLTPGL